MFPSAILSSVLATSLADVVAAEPYSALIDEDGFSDVQLLQKQFDIHTKAIKAQGSDGLDVQDVNATKLFDDTRCLGDWKVVRKFVSSGVSVEECAGMVDADPECSKTFYHSGGASNGDRCRCVMAGFSCNVQTMRGYAVYTTDGTTELEDGWYDGGEDQSCDQGCAAVGLVCTEEQLSAHNSDVDTSEKVKALISAVAGVTTDDSCSGDYGTSKGVPNWTPTACCHSTDRSFSTFDCAKTPTAGREKHRLCYCHKA